MRLTPLYLVLLLLPLAAWADPMGSVEGGGTLRLLAEHPTVSLNTEHLVFEPALRFTRITANLEMENHGDAASVPMGFPVPTWHPGSGQDFVKNFTVSVDGAPLEVTEAPRAQLDLGQSKLYCRWYKFTVPFEAGQKRQLACSYEVQGGDPQICYILATGGTWRDNIRSFELEVKLGERLNYHDLSLKGDQEPLPHEQRDGSLFWRCTDYKGNPELIWFTAKRGPAQVLLDGEKLWPNVMRRNVPAGDVPTTYNVPAVWHEGKLLLSADLLANLLMTSQQRFDPVEGEWQPRELSRQGVTCELKGLKFPRPPLAENEPQGLYVDPAPALEAFGGAITHQINAGGDLEVSLTSVPDSVPVARKLALATDINATWRLRCLRYLARHDRAALAEVAREVARLPHEDWTLLAALVGYTADDPQPAMTPQMALERQKLVNTNGTTISPADRLGIIIRLGQTQDDTVIRGAGLLLAALDGPAAEQMIIESLLSKDGSFLVSPGLLLCTLNQPGTAQKLVDALRPLTDRKPVNACLALGYLGDDVAIPYLQSMVRSHVYDGVEQAAGEALALMGTRQSIEACAAMLPERHESKWVPRNLLRGLQRAAGVQPEYGYYYPTRPPWAQSLTPAEAKAVVLPLARELKAKLPANYGKTMDEIVACCGG